MNAGSQPRESDSARGAAHLRRRTLGGYRYVRLRWRLLFGCLDTVGTLLFFITRFFSSWCSNRGCPGDPRRILLVQFDHLGDAIITTSMFGPLKQRFTNAHIDVLAAPWNCAVFDRVPEVDRVYVCRHNRFASTGLVWIPAMVLWGLRLRKNRYDLVIDVRGEFPHNVLLWLTGARRRLGWASGGGGVLLTDSPKFIINRPEVDSRSALLESLGIQQARMRPTFCPTSAAVETAKTAWSEFDQTSDRARIVLHVGAGTSAKRWPVEHWRSLVRRLTKETNATIALVGTSGDMPTARAILGPLPSPQSADWTGRFDVDELAAVLQQADVFGGGDSGPAHLAAAVGTSVVTLFSGTNTIEQWQPQGSCVRTLHHHVSCSPCHRKVCPLAQHPCMRGIQPDHVIEALMNLISKSLSRQSNTVSILDAKDPVS